MVPAVDRRRELEEDENKKKSDHSTTRKEPFGPRWKSDKDASEMSLGREGRKSEEKKETSHSNNNEKEKHIK